MRFNGFFVFCGMNWPSLLFQYIHSICQFLTLLLKEMKSEEQLVRWLILPAFSVSFVLNIMPLFFCFYF